MICFKLRSVLSLLPVCRNLGTQIPLFILNPLSLSLEASLIPCFWGYVCVLCLFPLCTVSYKPQLSEMISRFLSRARNSIPASGFLVSLTQCLYFGELWFPPTSPVTLPAVSQSLADLQFSSFSWHCMFVLAKSGAISYSSRRFSDAVLTAIVTTVSLIISQVPVLFTPGIHISVLEILNLSSLSLAFSCIIFIPLFFPLCS